MESHSSSNFTCRICKNVFDTQIKLEMHYKVEHPTKTPHHCDICGEDFMTDLFLNKHIRDFHKPTNGTSNCRNTPENTQLSQDADTENESSDMCYRIKLLRGFNYTSVSKIMSKCARNNQFWCACCYRNFNSRSVLRDHFRSDHILKENVAYICQICEVEKPTIEMMIAHLELHSLNLLTVNRFSVLRGACVKPRRNRDSIVDVFPNLASMKSESNPCEEVVDGVKQKLLSKYKIGSGVKFKQSGGNVNHDKYKDCPENLNIKSEWMMRNNKDLSYNQSGNNIIKKNKPMPQTPLVKERETTKTTRSKDTSPQTSARRRRMKRGVELKETQGDEEASLTNINQSYTGSMSHGDSSATPQTSSVSEPVRRTRRSTFTSNKRSRRQGATKQASESKVKQVVGVNDKRDNITNLSNNDLMHGGNEDLLTTPRILKPAMKISQSLFASLNEECSGQGDGAKDNQEDIVNEVNDEGAQNITDIKQSNELMNDSDSGEDNSPRIRENVELLLKNLSNDIEDNLSEPEGEPDVSSNSFHDSTDDVKSPIELLINGALVVDNAVINKSENDESDHTYSNSCGVTQEVSNSKSEFDPISPSKTLIKITKVNSHKRVQNNKINANNYYNQVNKSSEPAELETDDNPVIEKTDAICCTMCSMPFYNQDDLLDHVATHI